MNRNQGCGCVLLLLAIPAFVLLTPIGGAIVAAVGLIVLVLNTRLK